jgi:hypothetical protein
LATTSPAFLEAAAVVVDAAVSGGAVTAAFGPGIGDDLFGSVADRTEVWPA